MNAFPICECIGNVGKFLLDIFFLHISKITNESAKSWTVGKSSPLKAVGCFKIAKWMIICAEKKREKVSTPSGYIKIIQSKKLKLSNRKKKIIIFSLSSRWVFALWMVKSWRIWKGVQGEIFSESEIKLLVQEKKFSSWVRVDTHGRVQREASSFELFPFFSRQRKKNGDFLIFEWLWITSSRVRDMCTVDKLKAEKRWQIQLAAGFWIS